METLTAIRQVQLKEALVSSLSAASAGTFFPSFVMEYLQGWMVSQPSKPNCIKINSALFCQDNFKPIFPPLSISVPA